MLAAQEVRGSRGYRGIAEISKCRGAGLWKLAGEKRESMSIVRTANQLASHVQVGKPLGKMPFADPSCFISSSTK